LGERDQGGIKPPKDRVDGAVARDRPALGFGDRPDLTGDRRGAGAGLLERQPFDQELEVGWETTSTTIGTGGAYQTSQTILPILPHPTAGRAERNPVLTGQLRQRHLVFEERLQQAKSLEGSLPCLLRERRQGGGSAIPHLLVPSSVPQEYS
jgi:hypothetical protein